MAKFTDREIREALDSKVEKYYGDSLFNNSGMKWDRESGKVRLEMVDDIRDKMKILMNTPQYLRSLPEESRELYNNVYAALGILHDAEINIINFGR